MKKHNICNFFPRCVKVYYSYSEQEKKTINLLLYSFFALHSLQFSDNKSTKDLFHINISGFSFSIVRFISHFIPPLSKEMSLSSTNQNLNVINELIQIQNQNRISIARSQGEQQSPLTTSVLSTNDDNTSTNVSITNNNNVSANSNLDLISENSPQNVSLPLIPQRAFSRIRSDIHSVSSMPEYLPTYSLVIRDMPPTYPTDQTMNDPSSSLHDLHTPTTAGFPDSPPSYDNSRADAYIVPLIYLEAPIQPQDYWPITKKFYIYGFIIWPLWLIGSIFVLFGNEYKHDHEQGVDIKINTGRMKWARRCLFNFVILTAVSIYVSVALSKTK